MASLNKCMFIGNLGADPESNMTATGKLVVKFNIAVAVGYGEKQTTEWIRIVAWEKTAEYVRKWLRKGASVYVEGRYQTRSWDDKEGNKRYATEVVAYTIQGLSKGQEPQVTHEEPPTRPEPSGVTQHKSSPEPPVKKDHDDDLPF